MNYKIILILLHIVPGYLVGHGLNLAYGSGTGRENLGEFLEEFLLA